MRLVASVIVRNEIDRYLQPVLTHLLEFVDQVMILDDGSTDGTAEWITDQVAAGLPVTGMYPRDSQFWQDEGAARQLLLEHTLIDKPDWVLAIDADEFVTDGPALRALIERGGRLACSSVVSLNMQEVWVADDECLCIRQDGGWREHPVPILWRVPGPTVLAAEQRKPSILRKWRIPDRKVAPGREPLAVRELARFGSRHLADSAIDVLHFGWACEADRQARYQRYVEHDGGKYHAAAHLQSIMWTNDRVSLEGRDWPVLPAAVAAAVLARALREPRCESFAPNIFPAPRCIYPLGHGFTHDSGDGIVWVGD